MKAGDHSTSRLAFAAVLGAIGGALITGGFNYLSHQNDLDAKMIELSVGILRAAPTPETTPLREWAIDVIDKRAKFSFTPIQRAVLLKQELPFKYGVSWDYSFPLDPTTRRRLERELDRPLPPREPGEPR